MSRLTLFFIGCALLTFSLLQAESDAGRRVRGSYARTPLRNPSAPASSVDASFAEPDQCSTSKRPRRDPIRFDHALRTMLEAAQRNLGRPTNVTVALVLRLARDEFDSPQSGDDTQIFAARVARRLELHALDPLEKRLVLRAIRYAYDQAGSISK